MRYSLIRSLLSEEYAIAQRDTYAPEEFIYNTDSGTGQVVVGFFPDIGRFRMRGYILDRSRHTNYVPFEAYTTLEMKGGAKTVVFKLPGTPMTSPFNDGDRTSVARIGRNALITYYDGSSPSRPPLIDLIEQHSPDVLVQTATGFDTRPPRISREDKRQLEQEIEALAAERQEIDEYIADFPGMRNDPEILSSIERIRDRVAEIAAMLNIRV